MKNKKNSLEFEPSHYFYFNTSIIVIILCLLIELINNN